jgi:hypothetical protein
MIRSAFSDSIKADRALGQGCHLRHDTSYGA